MGVLSLLNPFGGMEECLRKDVAPPMTKTLKQIDTAITKIIEMFEGVTKDLNMLTEEGKSTAATATGMFEKIIDTLAKISNMIEEGRATDTLLKVSCAVDGVSKTLAKVSGKMTGMFKEIRNTSSKLSCVMKEVTGLATDMSAKVSSAVDEARDTFAKVSGMIEEAKGMLAKISVAMDEARDTFAKALGMLEEVIGQVTGTFAKVSRAMDEARNTSAKVSGMIEEVKDTFAKVSDIMTCVMEEAKETLAKATRLLEEAIDVAKEVRELIKETKANVGSVAEKANITLDLVSVLVSVLIGLSCIIARAHGCNNFEFWIVCKLVGFVETASFVHVYAFGVLFCYICAVCVGRRPNPRYAAIITFLIVMFLYLFPNVKRHNQMVI